MSTAVRWRTNGILPRAAAQLQPLVRRHGGWRPDASNDHSILGALQHAEEAHRNLNDITRKHSNALIGTFNTGPLLRRHAAHPLSHIRRFSQDGSSNEEISESIKTDRGHGETEPNL